MKYIAATVHTLNLFTRASDRLTRWAKVVFKPVREAVYPILSSPKKYHMMDEDDRLGNEVNNRGSECLSLSAGIVAVITNLQDNILDQPILQVVSKPDMAFKQNEGTQSKYLYTIHYTHLRLADGSTDQMMARLSM